MRGLSLIYSSAYSLSACADQTFGANCASQCHCLPNDTCSSINGYCSSGGCDPDWGGTACQIRQNIFLLLFYASSSLMFSSSSAFDLTLSVLYSHPPSFLVFLPRLLLQKNIGYISPPFCAFSPSYSFRAQAYCKTNRAPESKPNLSKSNNYYGKSHFGAHTNAEFLDRRLIFN